MGDYEMKKIFYIFISILLQCCICSYDCDIDNIVESTWISQGRKSFELDFSISMPFEWDTMYYISSRCSIDKIQETFGYIPFDFVDAAEYILFFKKNKLVYVQKWYLFPAKNKKGVTFEIEEPIKKFCLANSVFSVNRINQIFVLHPIKH